MTERAQAALALGRHLEVIGDLEPLVAYDPTLESLAGLLMLALYRSGRQAECPRGVHAHPRGSRPLPRLRTVDVAAVTARTGAAPRRHPRRPGGHGPRSRRDRDNLGGWSHDCSGHDAGSPVPRTEDRTAPTNLPTVVRPLIGRDAQLDSIAELLRGVRLLSLIGPGGAGKTSLALATVVRTSAHYPDGAFGVRLASVNAGDQVPIAVADALGMPMDGAVATRDLRYRLVSFLSRRRMLPAGRQLRARRGCCRWPHRRHPQPLPRHHRHRHQPRSPCCSRRGAGHRRPVGNATGGHPVRAGAQLPGGTAVRRGPTPCAPGLLFDGRT